MSMLTMLATADWNMSGYGAYVWTCVAAVLGGAVLMGRLSCRGLKKAKQQERKLQETQGKTH